MNTMENGRPRVAIFHCVHGGEKQSPCGLCAGDSKPCAYLRKGGPRDVGESLLSAKFIEWSNRDYIYSLLDEI
jgi:hypothetical protein